MITQILVNIITYLILALVFRTMTVIIISMPLHETVYYNSYSIQHRITQTQNLYLPYGYISVQNLNVNSQPTIIKKSFVKFHIIFTTKCIHI